MKQQPYLKDLKYIVESIDVGAEGQLSFRGQTYEGYDYPEASAEIRLFHNLTNLLYSACYTRGWEEKQNDSKKNRNQSNSFLSELRTANASVERYDCGWVLDEIEHNGNIIVRKSGYRRYTYAGNFIREHFMQGSPQRGELVNIRIIPEYGFQLETTDVFYFIFGEILLDNNNSSLARLYFNLMPKEAASLVAFISYNLNHYNIPFQFKCLNRPNLYVRCDSAVLYFDKRYFNIIVSLLLDSYPNLKNKLNSEVPMFTRQLAPGIGFAESPLSSSESFGTSRCKIISQGIINARRDKQPKSLWMDFILENIQKNYLHLETIYLNPNSKYPYLFPTFKP